jgi:hypothetical protein
MLANGVEPVKQFRESARTGLQTLQFRVEVRHRYELLLRLAKDGMIATTVITQPGEKETQPWNPRPGSLFPTLSSS